MAERACKALDLYVTRRERRDRLEAIDQMIATMEQAFGDIGEMIVDHAERHDIRIKLRDAVPYGFPEGTLANDVEFDLWECLGVLLALRDEYAAFTHKAERATQDTGGTE